MSSPVSWESCSRTCLAGLGLVLYANFKVSNCFAVIVVLGLLFGWSPSMLPPSANSAIRKESRFSREIKGKKKKKKRKGKREKCHLLPWPARNQVYKRAFYPPLGRTRLRCPTVESKGRTRNKLDDRSTLAPYARPETVPILGRSPRISSQNACHTNNIQHFHITFVY